MKMRRPVQVSEIGWLFTFQVTVLALVHLGLWPLFGVVAVVVLWGAVTASRRELRSASGAERSALGGATVQPPAPETPDREPRLDRAKVGSSASILEIQRSGLL
jgi:hypothetical protein